MSEVLQLDDQFPIVTEARRPTGPLRVLKHGDTFAVFDEYGDVMAEQATEEGLYHRGTRHLSRLEIRLAGQRPLLLSSNISDDNVLFVADCTNVDLRRGDRIELPHGEIHLFRSRVLSDALSIEKLRICSHGTRAIDLPVSIRFDADFADVFEVRGTQRARRGTRLPDRIAPDGCVLTYLGLDDVERRTRVSWTRQPENVEPGLAMFRLRLAPHETVTFELAVACEQHSEAPVNQDYEQAVARARERSADRSLRLCTVQTSNDSFNRWIRRSSADLEMMITLTPRGPYPYAGIPWFSTPFGRDGLIAAFELLWADPDLARGVLSFLASTQATVRADTRDAEPGKILHEMRHGEMAALGEVPFGSYYGSIDSTPLFVMLASAYFARTGDASLVETLWPHVLAALGWMVKDGDRDGDGFLEYARHSPNGLVHQGWKDSYDSVFHADGTLADPPIALCEVQGYAFAAWHGAAALAIARGETAAADQWRARADHLQQRFEESFWSDALGTYALALDGRKRPCLVRTSNIAHCLFTGIVSSRDRARLVAASLMDESSFAGWGVRTVAAGEPRYNPMSYHNGSIWPHDNAIAAAGLARYGFTDDAARILEAMLDLSEVVDLHRLPELLCGFRRRSEERPTLYPVACAPQSWAAGAVYLLLQAALGMQLDAQRRRITFTRPSLPGRIERLDLMNVVVAQASVDLRLERHAHDVTINVLRRDGEVEIVTIK
jgi:glycogen debranching enzyme